MTKPLTEIDAGFVLVAIGIVLLLTAGVNQRRLFLLGLAASAVLLVVLLWEQLRV